MSSKGKLNERLTMKGQIHKAYKVLLKIQNPKYFNKDKSIPMKIIQNAKGIAFMTVIKGGFLFSGTLGCGVVIARLPNGNWSGPSSIGVAGMGWGALIGASSTDSVIILNTDAAVKAFSGKGQIKFGGNLSVAVGPLGREGDASVYGGDGGAAACYSYSHSRGFFGGLSLQGAIIAARDSDNKKFYGQECSPTTILTGQLTPPPNEDYTSLIRCLEAIDNGVPLEISQNEAGSFSLTGEQAAGTSAFPDTTSSVNSTLSSAHSLGPSFVPPKQPVNVDALPDGWQEVKTDTGEVYFWNEKDDTTQWERPVNIGTLPASSLNPVQVPIPKPLPVPVPVPAVQTNKPLPVAQTNNMPVATPFVTIDKLPARYDPPSKQTSKTSIPARPVAPAVPVRAPAPSAPTIPNRAAVAGASTNAPPQIPSRPKSFRQPAPGIPPRSYGS